MMEKEKMMRIHMLNTLEALTQYRPFESGSHLKRITAYTGLLVQKMLGKPAYRAQLLEEDYNALITASALHDIGKAGIQDAILLKRGELTESECEVMKRHVSIGREIIDKALEGADAGSLWAKHCRDIVSYHHERWDGLGYLAGLKGEGIPLSARIVAVADAYDTLTGESSHTHEQAVGLIADGRGTRFDPGIVDCFSEAADEFRALPEERKPQPPT